MPGGVSGGVTGDVGPGGVDPGAIVFGWVTGDGPPGATGAIGGPDAGDDAWVAGDAGATGVAAGRATTARGRKRSPFDPHAATISVSDITAAIEQVRKMRDTIGGIDDECIGRW